MKKLIAFCLLLIPAFYGFAQTEITQQQELNTYIPFGNNIRFKSDYYKFQGNSDITVPDTAIDKVYNLVKPTRSYLMGVRSSAVLLGVKLNPKLKYYHHNDLTFLFPSPYRTFSITDNSEAVVVAMGINKDNVNNYRYHVIENDSIETVPWTTPKLDKLYGAKETFGLIGKFKVPGKLLLIEVINIKDYSIRDAVILNWQTNFKPTITEINVYNDGEYFNLADTTQHKLATKFDPSTNVPLNFKFRQDMVANIALGLKYHAPVPYSIFLAKKIQGSEGESRLIDSLGANETVYNFLNHHYLETGLYQLTIKSKNPFDTDPALSMRFEVLPRAPFLQKFSIKQMAPYAIGGLLIIGLCFATYHYYNKRKLRLAERARAMANVQLKSVRSQLNPHFMFNALTSIQNLMNQHDIVGANNYLNKFADLTRQVLKSSGQELISLEDELIVINNYLQMEQLRFGFKYKVIVNSNINKANTEIPAMLLQPFIENAARHGVGALGENGFINVTIDTSGEDIILIIADNGPGFNETKLDGGHGLKLSRERIALLNGIYKDQKITLAVDSTTQGVNITITLINWL